MEGDAEITPPLRPAGTSRTGSPVAALARWSFVLWAFCLVIYFEHREGLFPQFYLKPPAEQLRGGVSADRAGQWLAARRLPDIRLDRPDHAGSFSAVLQGLAGAGGMWDPNWENAPWIGLGYSALAA